MFVGTNGIVVDNQDRVLLILRDDTRTWAIPGGALDPGELPTNGVVREVKEETGISVTPSQLVGLYHWSDGSEDFLVLVFRCLIQGGELARSEESLQVLFAQADSLPKPVLSLHKERLERGLIHDGVNPYWGEQELTPLMMLWRKFVGPLVYRSKDLRRKIRGEPLYAPPLPWIVGAFVIIRNESGDILWVKRTDHDIWNLPGGGGETGEAPWTTAIRETREETGLSTELTGCSGIYVKPTSNSMIFAFTARVTGGTLTTGSEAADFAYFKSGSEPDNALPKHVERVADAMSHEDATLFRIQDSPPGLEVLTRKNHSR
jgi:ADP-ribose pyrophosphatase YjhB (NUDIX family)